MQTLILPLCEGHLPLYRIKKCGICSISCPNEISTRTWFEVDTYISFSLVRISHTFKSVRSDPSIILTLTRHAWLLRLVISSQCISETKSKANSESDTRCPCFTWVVIWRKQIKLITKLELCYTLFKIVVQSNFMPRVIRLRIWYFKICISIFSLKSWWEKDQLW